MTLRANVDDVKLTLRANGIPFKREVRLPNDNGWRVELDNGVVINCFDTGTCQVQGKPALKSEVEGLLQESTEPTASSGPAVQDVFVVYGHDRAARDQLENMLRRWGLNPLILEDLPSEGATIIEKLERYMATARYAVVLATPDDYGYVKDTPGEARLRARQNVVFELGILLGLLGRKRVAVLYQRLDNFEPPGDMDGYVYIPYADNVTDSAVMLAKEMNQQGFRIDLSDL